MSRKDRHDLDIWYPNWRVGWKLQTKDMKFSRSEQGVEVAPIEKFRYGVLKTMQDFFYLVTYEKAVKRTSKITTNCNTTYLNVERTIEIKEIFL